MNDTANDDPRDGNETCKPTTLLERLESEHRRLGERLNRTETDLRHVNAAIARLKEHPEDEAVYDLFKAASRY